MIVKNILSTIILYLLVQNTSAQDSKTELNTVEKCLDFGYCIFDSIRKPDVLLLHSSYCPTKKDSFDLPCILDLYKKHDVAAHFIIDREGIIYKMVNIEQVAYHGGKGELPDKNNQINTRSIGVELINSKSSYYTQNQYASLLNLWNVIKIKYPIKIITGHAETAPNRKTDPWNFDWKYFKQLIKEDSINVWLKNN